jgi:hypothetical protein
MLTPSRQGNQPSATNQQPQVTYVATQQQRGIFRNRSSSTTTSPTGAVTQRVTTERNQVPINSHLPSFLGNRLIITASWAISMAVVGYDDWKNNNILPRPSRLWATSLFYGLLALASLVEALVPIINAIAIGYTLMLIWNLFNAQGQFA